jgi:hypothetical protein
MTKVLVDKSTQTDDLGGSYNLQFVLKDEKLKAFTGVDLDLLKTLTECSESVTIIDITIKSSFRGLS